jgi:hypothetical protein
VRVPFGPADFGVVPEACARTAVTLETHGAVLIARDDFYGSLQAGVAVRGRLALPGGAWLSLWVPGVDYRYVANATITQSEAGAGAGAIGVHAPILARPSFTLVPYAHLLIPTDHAFEGTRQNGFEHGISSMWRLSPKLEIVGGWAMTFLFTSQGPHIDGSLAPTLAADAVYRPWRALGLAAGADARFVLGQPFESLDPRASVRLYPYDGLFVDVSAAFPLVGRDRTLAAAAVSIGFSGEKAL